MNAGTHNPCPVISFHYARIHKTATAVSTQNISILSRKNLFTSLLNIPAFEHAVTAVYSFAMLLRLPYICPPDPLEKPFAGVGPDVDDSY
jgi:hypothetical protein